MQPQSEGELLSAALRAIGNSAVYYDRGEVDAEIWLTWVTASGKGRSLEEVPEELRKKVITNLYRILKKDGLLIMTNWNLWNITNKKNIWKNKFNHNYQIPNSKHKLKFKEVLTVWQNKYPLYYHAFTLKELKKIFKQAGFKILENNYKNKNKSAHWWSGWNVITVGEK